MDDCEKRVMHQFRHRLANELVVTENFLSAFCEKNVLDEEMAAIIKNEPSLVSRAHRLIDILLRRGSRMFTILLDLLRITNPWLAEKMKMCYIEEKNRETKLRIQSHVTSAASIEGIGAVRHIDDDIKDRVTHYIDGNFAHLSINDQRSLEKWVSEEVQRERRRHNNRNRGFIMKDDGVGIPVQIIMNSKEIQTDTTMNDLQELYEDLAITLQGTEFDQDTDVSFTLIKEQIAEILDHNNKMDQMFMQCLDRFDDYNDRFRLPLPDLIDQLVIKEREAQLSLTEENRVKQKIIIERDFLEKQLNNLEAEFDNLMEKHRHIMVKSQRIPLRRRQDTKYLQVNDKNQTLPDNQDISIGTEDSFSPTRNRTATSRYRTNPATRSPAKPRWAQSSQGNIKVQKSSFETLKPETSQSKLRKPKVYTLKHTS